MPTDSPVLRQPPTPPVYNNTHKSWQTVLDYILRAGAQAPSWYNCQPWKFRVNDRQIELFLDDQADQSFYGWHNINSLLACGAALENMLIATLGRGIKVKFQSFPEPSEPCLVARISLEQQPAMNATALEQAIWTRHTNTLMFDNSELSRQQQDILNHSIADFPAASLHWLIGDEAKHKAFAAVSCAEQVRFSRRDLHEQLHRMIRWNDAEALADKTGYTLPSMGACAFGKLFFRLTRSWHIMRLMNRFGAYKDQAKRANLGLLHCSAVGLLTIKGQATGKALLTAGQAMQRLWLTATQSGLDLQPHSTITLFHLAWQSSDKAKLFSPSEQNTLSQAFQLYQQAFPDVQFTGNENGIFLFRVGKGLPVYGFTQRQPVAQLLK